MLGINGESSVDEHPINIMKAIVRNMAGKAFFRFIFGILFITGKNVSISSNFILSIKA